MDSFMSKGLQKAGEHAEIIIYGASPDTSRLGAWIPAGSGILREMDEMLEAYEERASYRNKTAGKGKIKARPLPGFSLLNTGPKNKVQQGNPAAGGLQSGNPGAGGPGGKPGGGGGNPGGGNPPGGTPGGGKGKQKINVNLAFDYADGTFSKTKRLFNWPGIAKEYNFDKDAYCGHYVLSRKAGANKGWDCLAHQHDHASHKFPQVGGKDFDAAGEEDNLKNKGLMVEPPELKSFKPLDLKTTKAVKDAHLKKFVPPGTPKMVNKHPVYPVFYNGGQGF